jgi:anti-sigma factor RsiW
MNSLLQASVPVMRLNNALLLACVDGTLPLQEREQVRQAIEKSATATERMTLLRASQLPYPQAFASQRLSPLPATLVKKVEQMALAAAQVKAATED